MRYTFNLKLRFSVMFYFLLKCLISYCVDRALAIEELLDWYQLLKEICQPKGFFMCSENHRLILKLKAFSASINWAGRQTINNSTFQFLRQRDTSLQKKMWRSFDKWIHSYADSVVKAVGKHRYAPGHFLFLIWGKIRVYVFTC